MTSPFGDAETLALPRQRELVGRDDLLSGLTEWATRRSGQFTILIYGVPGVGKTQVAIHLARRLSLLREQPTLYLNARSYEGTSARLGPEEILSTLLWATGFPTTEQPTELNQLRILWWTRSRSKRAVLVIDNVDSVSQIECVTPDSGTVDVVVTSRSRLEPENFTRIEKLPRLTPEQSVDLIALINPDSPPEVVRDLADRGFGNPFLITRAASILQSTGRSGVGLNPPAYVDLSLESAYRNVTLQTVASLSPIARKLYSSMMCGFPPHISKRRLLALTGASHPDLVAAIDDLFSLLILEPSNRRDMYVVHDLFKQHAHDEFLRSPGELQVAVFKDCLALVNAGSDELGSPNEVRRHIMSLTADAFSVFLSSQGTVGDGCADEVLLDLLQLCLDRVANSGSASDLLAEAREFQREPVRLSTIRAKVGSVIAACLWHTSRFADALSECNRALQEAETAGNELASIRAELSLRKAFTLERLGRNREAQLSARSALALVKGQVELESEAVRILGAIMWRSGDYDDALRQFREAESLARAAGSPLRIARALNNQGLCLYRLDELEAAEECLIEALTMATDQGSDSDYLTSVINYAFVMFAAGAPSVAAAAIEVAIQLAEDLEAPYELGRASWIRYVLLRDGGSREAAEWYVQTARLFEQQGSVEAARVSANGDINVIFAPVKAGRGSAK